MRRRHLLKLVGLATLACAVPVGGLAMEITQPRVIGWAAYYRRVAGGEWEHVTHPIYADELNADGSLPLVEILQRRAVADYAVISQLHLTANPGAWTWEA